MINPAERLTEDDRSIAAAEQFLERALAHQRWAAEHGAKPAAKPGTCRNCLAECEGVYCDHDCRSDHERRARRG